MPFINPFKRARCSYCFAEIVLGLCPVVSTKPPDDAAGPARYFPVVDTVLDAPPHGLGRLWRRVFVPRLTGARYADNFAARQCPKCDRVLPDDEYLFNASIALIGPRGTTRTTWMTVAIHQLVDEQALDALGCRVFPSSDAMARYYRAEYFEPLYGQHRPFGHTPTIGSAPGFDVALPLVYVLEFERPARLETRVPANSRLRCLRVSRWLFRPRIRRANLTLFDASGEQLTDPYARARYTRYLYYSAARIFFFDPIVMPRAWRWIRAAHDEPNLTEEEALKRVGETVDLFFGISRELGRRQERLLNAPTGIVITKSDLLEYLAEALGIDLDWINHDPDYSSYSEEQIREESESLAALLKECKAQAILAMGRRFRRPIYQAMSPTGGPPDADGHYSRIEPVRTLFVLIALLQQMGLLDLSRSATLIGPTVESRRNPYATRAGHPTERPTRLAHARREPAGSIGNTRAGGSAFHDSTTKPVEVDASRSGDDM